MNTCEKCNKTTYNLLETVYGEILCEDCWDEYINTERGLVEYFGNIICEEAKMTDFDADFLCSVIASWNKYKYILPIDLVYDWEKLAKNIGLLDA